MCTGYLTSMLAVNPLLAKIDFFTSACSPVPSFGTKTGALGTQNSFKHIACYCRMCIYLLECTFIKCNYHLHNQLTMS